LVHYKDDRYFLHGGIGKCGGIDQYATGQKAINNQEGTWMDAEDGVLSGNSISQGSVDSIIALHLDGDPKLEQMTYAWLAAGDHIDDVTLLHQRAIEEAPHFLERTHNYWSLWSNKEETDFGPMPPELITQYKRSLLTIRTQIDNSGGILAANDSDIQAFAGDTYSYVWPRDGALVAYALDEAGRHELSNNFFNFCGRVVHREGYFMHKYNPDGTLASSWHPYFVNGRPRLPIQEDETALVIIALREHYQRSHDLELLESMYGPLGEKAAEFMVRYRDHGTRLPEASYDLWEEKRGISTFTAGATYGALIAAADLAKILGKVDSEKRYREAAEEIRAAILKHLWDESRGVFLKLILPAGKETVYDQTIDISSVYGVFAFGVLPPDDPRLAKCFEKTVQALARGIQIGGLARYENDGYCRVDEDVAGNPWAVTTLWYAEYLIATAKNKKDLERVRKIFSWVAEHALASGVISEQFNAKTGAAVSATPLCWSHAGYVLAVLKYEAKVQELSL